MAAIVLIILLIILGIRGYFSQEEKNARLYALYYFEQTKFPDAAQTLYNYCNKLNPLSEAANDPRYQELLALYAQAPAELQSDINILRCGVNVSLNGYENGHEWIAADCVTPKTFSVCGETTGNALGHLWEEATCIKPKRCTRCGEMSGAALGHLVNDFTVTQAATCSESGKKEGICERCGETIESSITKIAHTPGDWEILTESTSTTSPGIKVRYCTVCGEIAEQQTYYLSAEEAIQAFKDSCQGVTYEELSRYPEKYKGEKIKVTVHITDVDDEGLIFYTPYLGTMGGQEIAIEDGRAVKEPKLLKGDTVTVYGYGAGLTTVKIKEQGLILKHTVDSYDIPCVKIEYCSIG